MNINLQHVGEYRLEISTCNLIKADPQFTATLKDAKKQRKLLKELGYVVTIFHVTNSGGLSKV